MIARTLREVIDRACRTFPAVVLTGPRQSGKTTLLRHGWGATHRYLSLENPDVRQRALADPVGFLRDTPPPVILDEIQYAPGLLPYIKSWIDEDRAPGSWLLTGSQSFALMAGVTESLAGRAAILTLLPLSAREAMGVADDDPTIAGMLRHALEGTANGEAPPDLAEWLLRGSYPELAANPQVDRGLWYASYVQTYLERDVRQVIQVGNLQAFERFVRLAAARNGQILNTSELARDCGISVPTASSWLSVLEAGGIVYLLRPYHSNFGKRLIKSPKLYFMDPGLVTYLLGLHTPEPTLRGPFLGPLMESVVVGEWVRAFRHRGHPPALSFWRSGSGLEVDLVVEWDGVAYPIEVKATATPDPSHAAGLVRWRELAGAPNTPALVACRVDRPMTLAPGVRAVPWWWV